MAIDLEKYRIEALEYANNTSDRVPICLLIDTSKSMVQEKRMEKVNQGIKKFIDDMKKDFYASESVELSVITFGNNKAEIKIPFEIINKVNFEKLIPNGNTPLELGAKMAIETVEERLNYYNEIGVNNYNPWIIIFSDGIANDVNSYKRYAKKLCELQQENHWKVMCIGLGDEKNSLADFSPHKRVYGLKDVDISDFFEWISQSVSGISRSRPDIADLEDEYRKFKDQLL